MASTVLQISNLAPAFGVIYSANATDPDSGLNGRVQYSLTAGNASTRFSVNAAGVISTTTELFSRNCGAAGQPSVYSLSITAADGGVPPLSAVLRVLVVVHPVLLSNSSNSIVVDWTYASFVRPGRVYQVLRTNCLSASDSDCASTDQATLIYVGSRTNFIDRDVLPAQWLRYTLADSQGFAYASDLCVRALQSGTHAPDLCIMCSIHTCIVDFVAFLMTFFLFLPCSVLTQQPPLLSPHPFWSRSMHRPSSCTGRRPPSPTATSFSTRFAPLVR